MPPRFCCCCAADAAVIADTGKEARRLSQASSVQESLAYMDAVQDFKDLEEPVALSRQGSGNERFFDAIQVVGSDQGSVVMNESSRKVSNRTETTTVSSTADLETPEDENNDDDEALLAPEYRTDGSMSTHRRRRRHSPEERGFPGFLTKDQLKAYRQLRDELRRHPSDSIYHQMAYNYIDLEPESYALCRYLRLYNFNVKKVLHHMDSHAAKWKQAATHDFYPDVFDAVGAPLSVLLTQFPFLYYGLSKKGFPCCYFNAEALSVEGVECVTDCDHLANVIWHNMMYDLKYNKFPEAKKRHPDFNRLEQITILNLKGLSRSVFTTKMYHTLQQVNSIAGIFPEMLHSVVIVNAPGFFSFFWSIISRLLDDKLKALIEIYSSSDKGRQRLLELVDENELPRDYGGKAPSTSEIILRQGRTEHVPHRQIVELLHLGGKEHRYEFALEANERVELALYTRSTTPYDFALSRQGVVVHKQEVHSDGGLPARFDFESNDAVHGPGKFTMESHCADRRTSGTHYFLLIGEVFRA